MWPEFWLILGSYLLGSLPIVYAIGWLRGVDLREAEDAHITLWRDVGRLEGLVGILTDMAKGAIPVLVALELGFDHLWVALGGLAAVIGLMWPVFLKFDGEKANTAGLGMSAALAPLPLLYALIPMLIGALIRTMPRLLNSTESVNERLKLGGPPSLAISLGLLIGFATLPLSSWLLGKPMEITLVLVALFVVIVIKRLTADVRKDLRGAENKRSILLNRFLFDHSFR